MITMNVLGREGNYKDKPGGEQERSLALPLRLWKMQLRMGFQMDDVRHKKFFS
jgi:hypothetical protein